MKLLKLILVMTLLLLTGACTRSESISAEIRGTKLDAKDAKALYEAYEALKKEEVQPMKDTRLIGGGDIDIVFTVGDKRISVTGQSMFGMLVLEDGICFADPFDDFFDINREIREKIRRKFAELGGTKHVGDVIPISAEFKVSQLQTNLVNEQFFELQGLTTKHIANAFGVKSFQLNDLERSTYANIAEQNRDFYQSTLINVLSEYEQEIDCKLLKLESRFFSRFNVDSLLRSTPLERSQQYESALRNSWMSVAEVRRMEQLPYVEGTDILICGNGASIPFKDLGKQYGAGDTEETGNGKGGEENAENPV